MITAAGYIEAISYAQNFVLVRGYAIGAGGRTPTRLQIFYDGRLIDKVPTFYERPGLETAGLHEPCAYVVTLPLSELGFDPRKLVIYGPELELRVNARTRLTPFCSIGHIERFSPDGVHGWVYDGREYDPNRAVWLRVNGSETHDVVLTRERRDVVHHGVTDSMFTGFLVPISAILAPQSLQTLNHQLNPATSIRLELVAFDRVVTELVIDVPAQGSDRIRGRLEGWNGETVYGWAVDIDTPEMPVTVEIMIDDIAYQRSTADHERLDLEHHGISCSGGGFVVPLRLFPTSRSSVTIKARTIDGTALEGALTVADPPLITSPQVGAAARWRTGAYPNSSVIIVPIYDAHEELTACLEALQAYTNEPAKLILIDDASTDERNRLLLSSINQYSHIEIISNQLNIGYTRTINLGIKRAGCADVVLLNSDTIVSPGWLEHLRFAAYSHPKIATATPWSDNAGAFSTPMPEIANGRPSGFGAEAYARAITQSSRMLFPRVPTGSGFCLYMRRDAIDMLGLFDENAFPRGYGEENDFCMRATRAGWSHVIDDRTLIYHARSASFGSQRTDLTVKGRRVLDARYPEYAQLVRGFQNRATVAAARYTVSQLWCNDRPEPRPRILYMLSMRTGGTPQTNRDLMEVIQRYYEPFILHCNGFELQLSRVVDGEEVAVTQHKLVQPLEPGTHNSEEYDEIFTEWLAVYAFELVHVRHIAFHSLGIAEICRSLSVPIVFSFHDFYTICPTVKLLDENKTFCGGHCTAGPGPCAPELWKATEMPRLKHHFVAQWQNRMEEFLKSCALFITTSPTAWATLAKAYPFLAKSPHSIIRHGRSFKRFRSVAPSLARGEPLRIVVPGNISAAKGAELIAAIATLDKGQTIEFHILGAASSILRGPGIILHQRYLRDELLERIEALQPHIGAVFSIWPETYCHTLTEMWACGLPVAGLPFGAVKERLRESGAGWLLKSSAPQSVLEQLQAIAAEPTEIEKKRVAAIIWQNSSDGLYNVEKMAQRYNAVYAQVKLSRRAFKI